MKKRLTTFICFLFMGFLVGSGISNLAEEFTWPKFNGSLLLWVFAASLFFNWKVYNETEV